MIRSSRPARRQHRRDIGAVGVRRDLHAGFRQSRAAQPGHQRRVDRRGAVHAFRSAAQDHRVARLQADAGGIGADIRPAFVDHADHADRRGDALDAQPVRPRPVGQRAAERIGQQRDVLQPLAMASTRASVSVRRSRNAAVPVQAARSAALAARMSADCDAQAPPPSHAAPHCALRPACARQHVRGGARRRRGALQMLGGFGLDVHRATFLWCQSAAAAPVQSNTRSSRWMISSRPRQPRIASISSERWPAMRSASALA